MVIVAETVVAAGVPEAVDVDAGAVDVLAAVAVDATAVTAAVAEGGTRTSSPRIHTD